MTPHELSACAAAEAVRSGALTAVELTRSCLDRITAVDGEIQAWTHLDPEHALAQASERDATQAGGGKLGLLHGVPVGIKDIFDTKDMPTGNGSVLHDSRRPFEDAACVAQLRAAGAVIMGKTVTTEFALYAPGKTRNPHDPARTPGGSSSGSAAAVAARMVPLAIGSQTNGSVVRPAAFCGIFGYKPTHGLISRHNVLALSRELDHVGGFARNIGDMARLAEAMMAFDGRDPDMRPDAAPDLATAAATSAPPRIAFVETPLWSRADKDTKAAFGTLADTLGAHIMPVELPEAFDSAIAWHTTILCADLARGFAAEYEEGRDRMSPRLRDMIERGQALGPGEREQALENVATLKQSLDELFGRYDVILTPAARGEAPLGLEATGDPAFCTIWTLCGVPAVTVPILEGGNGMPMGAQLVAARGEDARLFRAARWLAEFVGR